MPVSHPAGDLETVQMNSTARVGVQRALDEPPVPVRGSGEVKESKGMIRHRIGTESEDYICRTSALGFQQGFPVISKAIRLDIDPWSTFLPDKGVNQVGQMRIDITYLGKEGGRSRGLAFLEDFFLDFIFGACRTALIDFEVCQVKPIRSDQIHTQLRTSSNKLLRLA